MVSIVVAVLAAAAALKAGLVFGALLAAFFVFSNFMTIRSARDLEKVDVNQRLVQLLWAGRSDEARDLLADRRPTPRCTRSCGQRCGRPATTPSAAGASSKAPSGATPPTPRRPACWR